VLLTKHLQAELTVKTALDFSEAEIRLITHEYLMTYVMKDGIDRLYESAHRAATDARNSASLISIIFVIGSMLTIVVNTSVVNRTISKRIADLSHGVGIIGAGNLNHRIAAEGDDELSDLARSSNEMADRLRLSHTSIENLQKEIAAREQAENQIKELNLELEQRVIVRTAQLEAVNRELEMFSYSISHDLRVPLRHMIGFVELLNKWAPDSFDPKIRHYLTIISDSATQMSMLIDDLLSFSRMGRAEMSAGRVRFDKLIRYALNTLQAETTGRDIVWNIEPLPEVRGDPAMLQLVMTNLISNALKFTRNKTRAEITIACISGSAGEHIFSVRDNGAGFDMKYYDKLFNLFQRLHRAEDFEGTGVGLAHVRRIISRHGGRTWAEGVVGGGAVFFFSLPAMPQRGRSGESTVKIESPSHR
jgi:signal transduction histidine kinase